MNKQDKPGPKRDFSFDILYFIAAMFSVLLIRDYLVGTNHVREIPYSEFKQRLDKSEVKDCGRAASHGGCRRSGARHRSRTQHGDTLPNPSLKA